MSGVERMLEQMQKSKSEESVVHPKVMLHLSCSQLPRPVVAGGRHAPFVVVWTRVDSAWSYHSRTETGVVGERSYFQVPIELDFDEEEHKELLIEVFFGVQDTDWRCPHHRSAQLLEDCAYVGGAEVLLSHLVLHGSSDVKLKDRRGDRDAPAPGYAAGTTLHIIAAKLQPERASVCFRPAALGLHKCANTESQQLFRPFLLLFREDATPEPHSSRVLVHSTPVAEPTSFPVWKPFLVQEHLLAGPGKRPTRLVAECWHLATEDEVPAAQFLAAARVSLQPVLDSPFISLPLSAGGADSTGAHLLLLNTERVEPMPVEQDKVRLVAAVDFSASNGSPVDDPSSLHFLGHAKQNEYVGAVESIQQVFADAELSLLAFGAEGSGATPIELGDEVSAYTLAIESGDVGLGSAEGKALAPLIDHFREQLEGGGEQCAVLVIVTDGGFVDLPAAQSAIVRLASVDAASSVIIVGVGGGDFSSLETALCSSLSDVACPSTRMRADRPITQFLRYRAFSENRERLGSMASRAVASHVTAYLMKAGAPLDGALQAVAEQAREVAVTATEPVHQHEADAAKRLERLLSDIHERTAAARQQALDAVSAEADELASEFTTELADLAARRAEVVGRLEQEVRGRLRELHESFRSESWLEVQAKLAQSTRAFLAQELPSATRAKQFADTMRASARQAQAQMQQEHEAAAQRMTDEHDDKVREAGKAEFEEAKAAYAARLADLRANAEEKVRNALVPVLADLSAAVAETRAQIAEAKVERDMTLVATLSALWQQCANDAPSLADTVQQERARVAAGDGVSEPPHDERVWNPRLVEAVFGQHGLDLAAEQFAACAEAMRSEQATSLPSSFVPDNTGELVEAVGDADVAVVDPAGVELSTSATSLSGSRAVLDEWEESLQRYLNREEVAEERLNRVAEACAERCSEQVEKAAQDERDRLAEELAQLTEQWAAQRPDAAATLRAQLREAEQAQEDEIRALSEQRDSDAEQLEAATKAKLKDVQARAHATLERQLVQMGQDFAADALQLTERKPPASVAHVEHLRHEYSKKLRSAIQQAREACQAECDRVVDDFVEEAGSLGRREYNALQVNLHAKQSELEKQARAELETACQAVHNSIRQAWRDSSARFGALLFDKLLTEDGALEEVRAAAQELLELRVKRQCVVDADVQQQAPSPLVARVGVKLEDEQDNPLVAQRQAEQVLEVWKRSALSLWEPHLELAKEHKETLLRELVAFDAANWDYEGDADGQKNDATMAFDRKAMRDNVALTVEWPELEKQKLVKRTGFSEGEKLLREYLLSIGEEEDELGDEDDSD